MNRTKVTIDGNEATAYTAHQINEVIHDAVGDEAEIIFGAGSDPAMEGEVRVTVIATGFDRAVTGEQLIRPGATMTAAAQPGVIPIAARRAAGTTPRPAPAVPRSATPLTDLPDMEIPTFIRRQMD